MFNWNSIEPLTAKGKCYASMRKILTAANYGSDGPNGWTMTDLIKSRDTRRIVAFEVIAGSMNGKRQWGTEVKDKDGRPMAFRLRVLTRQACMFDKKGNRIFDRLEGRYNVGDEENDIVATPNDKPLTGDVVRVKGNKLLIDEDGNNIDLVTRLEMEQAGEPIYDYQMFEVDSDGCISVPYPHVHELLLRAGKRIAMPEWAKSPKGRKLTNWMFEEVVSLPKKRRTPKPAVDVPSGMEPPQA